MPAQTFDTVPHIVLAAHGNIGSGETWSCTLRTTLVEAGVPQADLSTLAAAAAAAWKTAVTSMNGWPATVGLSGVTARSVDSRGITTTLAEGTAIAPAIGAGSQTLPNQCATVVTLLTARAGRTGKGRIYLPLLGLALVTTSGLIAPASVTDIASGTRNLIVSLNTALAALATAPKIAVQSKTSSAQSPGEYTGAAITSVKVGNVVDTQQRRRASLVEAYTASAAV
jgi:hypothetical protein